MVTRETFNFTVQLQLTAPITELAPIRKPAPPKEAVDCSDIETSMSHRSGDDSYISKWVTKDTNADTVITHLVRLVRKTRSNMPNMADIHLRHFTKKHVHEGYFKQFYRLYPSETCSSEVYF